MKGENPEEIGEDIFLIRQTLLGDKATFEKLVLKYRPAIYALALSYAKNAADAEDLTQEVFIKAYQNLACLKKLEQFPFWLQQIARNHCKNWLSRRGERPVSFDEIKVVESAEIASSPEEMALKQELREIVWQAIDSLLEIDRKLLEARYLEDTSLKQLQSDYGLSYCAIAGRLKRAKQKVRQQVQKLLGGFCALPGWEVIEKLFLGGIEVVKLSLKTKLVTVATVAVLGLGGAGVWHWHSKPVPKNPTVVHRQEVRPKETASAAVTPKVVIPKPAPKTAPQLQPANPPAQAEEKQEEISDEEWAELEQWLDEMEQSDEQNEIDELTKESEAEPEPEWITQARQELDELERMERHLYQRMKELSLYMQTYHSSLPNEELEKLGQELQSLLKQDMALLDKIFAIRKIIKEYEESKQQ